MKRGRLQLIRPARAALAAGWGWQRAAAASFFLVALAMFATALDPAPRALGWSLVALGGAHALSALSPLGLQARGLLAAVGAAYAVCGSLLIVDPLAGPVLLLAALAFALFVGGLVQAIAAIARRHAQSAWAVAGGLAIAALGAMVAFRWPFPMLPTLGVTLGIAAAAEGAVCLKFAAVGKRLAQRKRRGHWNDSSAAAPWSVHATRRLVAHTQ